MPRFCSFFFLSLSFFGLATSATLGAGSAGVSTSADGCSVIASPSMIPTTTQSLAETPAISIVDRPLVRGSDPLRRAILKLPLVLGLLPSAVPAAELFAADQPLSLRLEAPLRTIFRERDDPKFRPSRIVVAGADGADVTVDLQVRVRGKSRVQACEFPPLLLNFPEEQPEGSPFAGEDRLKLVTHCDATDAYEQYVRVERQIYLVLNLLTEASLRTRLLTVTYYDSEHKREVATKVGFLIEDEKRFAERSNLAVVADNPVDVARYDPAAFALVDVFEYFIGNTDWSAAAGPAGGECCHNVVPFARADDTPDDTLDNTLLPVPYDFDSSGLVDAPYALPAERLRIQSVRQRLYRGRCRDVAALQPVFAAFTERRAAIEALFTPAAGLADRTAARARAYIDAFYAILGDAEETQEAFVDEVCKG